MEVSNETSDIAFWVCKNSDIIRVFNEAGQQIDTIGSGGYGDGEFSYPQGLCIKGGEIYVADQGNNRIQKFTTEGLFLDMFSQRGSALGEFNQPVSVIVDQGDWMIIADQGNNRVAVLDLAGTWLFTINGDATGSHFFSSPCGLALDSQGNIHVTANASRGYTIKIFTSEGKYVRSYGDVKDRHGIVINEEARI